MKSDLAEEMKRCLSYDASTGQFVWLISRGRARSGTIAGHTDIHGYICIRLNGAKFRAHKLAWLYVYDEWPVELDHIDRDKANNRISNLRLSTRSQNAANRGVRSDSSVGLKGVSRLKSGFRAEIRHKGNARHIGVFKSASDAHAAYMAVSRDLHGEFSPVLEGFGEQDRRQN